MIVNKNRTSSAVAQDALLSYRYRKEFGLTAQQMLDEPNHIVMQVLKIWELEAERDRLEERRSKQRGQK